MDVLDTIEDILSHNLKELRGDARQEDVARGAKVPERTYQRIEAGSIPKKRQWLAALAKYHRVTVGRLFLDPDLIPEPTLSPRARLISAILAMDDAEADTFLTQITLMRDPGLAAKLHALAGTDKGKKDPGKRGGDQL